MQVSPSEGLANHTVPESCADTREGVGEALTGVRIGWVLSRENTTPGSPTLCFERKATWPGASSHRVGPVGGAIKSRVLDPGVNDPRVLLGREVWLRAEAARGKVLSIAATGCGKPVLN